MSINLGLSGEEKQELREKLKEVIDRSFEDFTLTQPEVEQELNQQLLSALSSSMDRSQSVLETMTLEEIIPVLCQNAMLEAKRRDSQAVLEGLMGDL